MLQLTSQHLIKLISGAFPGLVTYVDKNYRYQFASEAFRDWFGETPDQLIGKSVAEIIGEENFRSRKDAMDRVLKGKRIKFRSTIKHKTLGLREVEQVYEPDVAEDGKIHGFVSLAYDITEQRKAEIAAQENESRFRSLTEVMPQLVWIADPEGRSIFFNNNWPKVTGTRMEDNLGYGWTHVLHPEDRVATMLQWKEALKNKQAFDSEYRIKMKDGNYRWHVARAIPIMNLKGEIQRWVGTTTDIEAQKNARDLADRERQKIYSLFMQAPVMITVLKGPDHVIEMMNPAGRFFIGNRDITGQKIREVLPELEEQGFFKLLDEIFFTGHGRSITAQEVKLKSPDGQLQSRYYDLFYEPIKDEQGVPTGILNLAVDVTEQVLALKRAEQSETLFRTYAESMPQMAFIADSRGDIHYYNKKWLEFTGIDFKKTVNLKNMSVYHPEDLPDVVGRWAHSITTGDPYEMEFRLNHKDGTYRWHLGRAVPLRDGQNEITQWVGTNTDIHDQKEIEANQSRILQLLESSSDLIGIADLEGKAIYLNSAGRRMIGFEDERDISTLRIIDCFFEEDIPFVQNVILPVSLRDGRWVGDFRFRHQRTNEEIWVHYNAFVTRDDKTGKITGYATVSRDLTEIKQKERKLEEALRARDQFLSIASHELKTPLTSLKLQSQLILRTLATQKRIPIERQESMAHQTNQLVGRLNRLIDDMLDVSRIKTGKLQLDMAEHDLADIIREIVLRMSVLFEAASLDIPTLSLPEKIFITCDRFRIEQVIGNLLTNAIRYGQGKPVKVQLSQVGSMAVLKVTDKGYGIALQDQGRIFERFERAIDSSEVSGLGLGLFISKEIVESHNGRIWVESELSKGSTFYVELPLRR
jgi:PAS domain S-box-containing protein